MTAAIFLGKAAFFFYQNPQFSYFWDWPGHLEKARVATWPWTGGWDTAMWGGYPTWLYPNLFHLLLKEMVKIFGAETTAVALAGTGLLIGELAAAWNFCRRFISSKRKDLIGLSFLITAWVISVADRTLMGSFIGTLFTGGAPGALGTALLLLFLSTERWIWQGILLGLMFLSHPLSAIVGLIYLTFQLIVFVKTRQVDLFKRVLWSLMSGLVIGLPWLLPQLDPSFASTSLNLPGSVSYAPWVIIALVSVISLERGLLSQPLVMTVLATGVLAVIPADWAAAFNLINLRGWHFYRFSWYLMILAPTAVMMGRWNFGLKKSSWVVVILFLVIGIWSGESPKQVARLEIDEPMVATIKTWQGRVMDVSRHAFSFGFAQTMEQELVKNSDLVGSTRWIWEAGSRGLLYFGLKNAIDPMSFKDGTFLTTFNDPLGNPRQPLAIKETANLLGVTHISYTSRILPAAGRTDVWKLGEIKLEVAGAEQQRYYYLLEKVGDIQMAQSLAGLPEVDRNIDLGEWWINTDRKQLFTREPIRAELNFDFSQPKIEIIDIGPTKIHLAADSENYVPMILKFSYSPYWSAKPLTPNSKVIQPEWVTPGQMFLAGSGEFELTWETPKYMRIFSGLSAASLGMLVAVGLVPRRRR